VQNQLALALQYELSKVGFPIRKSADQSSFAAPHGLSQRITSFIASQRQGIHRMLLRHLIVLMIDVRKLTKAGVHMIRKTIYACRTHTIKPRAIGTARSTLQDVQLSHVFPLHNDKQRHSSSPKGDNQQNLNFPGLILNS
jgi:hypothetical protein